MLTQSNLNTALDALNLLIGIVLDTSPIILWDCATINRKL